MHKNHRERVKNRFLKEGLDSFADHEVLEFLLFFAIPQKDTNPLAHTLLDHFGSLSAVFDADIAELTNVPGIGLHCATLIKSIPSLARRYISDGNNDSDIYDTIAKVADFLIKKYIGSTVETVYLILLDNKYRMIDCVKVHEGSINSALISTRKLAEIALFKRASMVVLAHNHPNGTPIPSSDDLYTTQSVADAFSALEITMLDHILVAGDKYTTLLNASQSVFRSPVDRRKFFASPNDKNEEE